MRIIKVVEIEIVRDREMDRFMEIDKYTDRQREIYIYEDY